MRYRGGRKANKDTVEAAFGRAQVFSGGRQLSCLHTPQGVCVEEVTSAHDSRKNMSLGDRKDWI